MTDRLHIIGVGSPFGDDRLGWVAAEQLRDFLHLNAGPERIVVSILDRPGAMLLAQWKETDEVIVIDAMRSRSAPGTWRRLAVDDLALSYPATSHGFGVASALELARELGNLPRRLCVYGIEIDASWPGPGLSPAVAAAMPALVREVEAEVARRIVCSSPDLKAGVS